MFLSSIDTDDPEEFIHFNKNVFLLFMMIYHLPYYTQ